MWKVIEKKVLLCDYCEEELSQEGIVAWCELDEKVTHIGCIGRYFDAGDILTLVAPNDLEE